MSPGGEAIIAVGPDGALRCIYTDAVDVRALADELGELKIERAAHVEPTFDGYWTVELSDALPAPCWFRVIRSFQYRTRTEALAFERDLIESLLGIDHD